jgi:predicted Zn finger-like uncharacterized protein
MGRRRRLGLPGGLPHEPLIMALAARCPHCRALFRVVADQLKLRGGLVRCGECRHVFDAIGSLSYVDERALPSQTSEAPIGGAALPGPAVAAPAIAARPPAAAARPPAPAAPTPAHRPAAKAPPDRIRRALEPIRDELAVPTLFGAPEAQGQEAQDEGTAVAARIQQRRAAAPAGPETYAVLLDEEEVVEQAPEVEAQEPEAPSFLTTEDQRREQRLRRVLAAACVPLALLALVQIGLGLRSPALEVWPGLHPLLARACSLYGCSVGWPERAELLTIVGSELAAIPGTDVIELNAAIRSRAPFVMALPAIEVTLTDTQNRTIARKVFLPVDYLASGGEPSSRLDEGLSPGSDLSVRLVFEARGLSASGFVLYPFYL